MSGRSGALEPWSEERAGEIIAGNRHLAGAALPILHALQETFGYVPEGAIPLVADTLNLSRAEIHGVVTFYHDFRREPGGRHTLKICRAEACQSVGAAQLAADFLAKEDVAWHGTTADGALTVEPTFCLGLCACGPAALLDGEPLAHLDAAALADIAREARAA